MKEDKNEEVNLVNADDVLEEYKKRQIIEHLTGPIISVGLHFVALLLCFVFMIDNPQPTNNSVEFKSFTMEVKTIPPKEDIKDFKPNENSDDTPIYGKVSDDSYEEFISKTTGENSSDNIDDFLSSTNDNGITDSVLDVKPLNSPLSISSLTKGRKEVGREKSLLIYGDKKRTKASEKAVINALRWLKDHQSSDGSWSKSQPDAMAGLAILCFLAHGELADSKEFGNTVSSGIKYLNQRMIDSNGKINGSHGYPHAIVTYAICEAYGMTKNPCLREAMEKGLETIINGQMDNGGFNYDYSKNGRWDLSFTGWNVQALKAGFMAGSDNYRLSEALVKSGRFIKEISYNDGRFGYEKAGVENGNFHMTEVGTLCLQILGEGNSDEVKKSLRTLDKNVKIKWNDEKRESTSLVSFEPYGWYYDTQARFYAGGTIWKDWDKNFSQELTRNQNKDGHWDAPPSKDGKNIGEIEPYYATTLCCLMLEVYYRFLPSFKLGENQHKDSRTLELD